MPLFLGRASGHGGLNPPFAQRASILTELTFIKRLDAFFDALHKLISIRAINKTVVEGQSHKGLRTNGNHVISDRLFNLADQGWQPEVD